MIHDGNLKFNPVLTGANAMLSVGAGNNFYPFPGGYAYPGGIGLGEFTVLDLKVRSDFGRGTPVMARMEITTALGSTDAALKISLAIGAADDTNFTVNPLVLGAGEILPLTAATAGAFSSFVIPEFGTASTATAFGRRYLFLGLVLNTAITITNPIFNAGVMQAGFVLGSQSDAGGLGLPVMAYASGWNAAGV